MSYPKKIENILSFEKKFEKNIFYLYKETGNHRDNFFAFIACCFMFAVASLFFSDINFPSLIYIIAMSLSILYCSFFIFFSLFVMNLKLYLAINPYTSLKTIFYCLFLNHKFKESEREYNRDKEKIQKLIYSLTKEEYLSLVSLKNDRKHKGFYNTIITYCIKDMTKNCYLDLSSSRELHLKKTEEREIIND